MLSGEEARRARGFTILELLVVIAVIGLLAALIAPQVISRMSSGSAATLAGNFSGLADAARGFRADVGRYPAELVSLSEQPTTGATDTCDRPFPAHFLSRWRGPYTERLVDTTGVQTGEARIRNEIGRDPATYSPTGNLFIEADGVTRDVADIIEEEFDGNGDLNAGAVRWTATPATGDGTLTYAFPIRGC